MIVDHMIDAMQVRRVRQGAVAAHAPSAIFELTGSGAIDCLQGLLTNDVAQPGAGSLVYGALLTPKGMIAVDFWVVHGADRLLLITSPQGREPAQEIFRRTLPPRLARAREVSDTHTAVWLLGEQIAELLAENGGLEADHAPGQVRELANEGTPALLGRPDAQAPFAFLLVGETDAVERTVTDLRERGALAGNGLDVEAARILAGWPALGAEIDERTLPQEVRFDELGGVSYTKGCYIGQETVARVHFRGHPNRLLRGLYWRTPERLDGRIISTADREVGTVRSTLKLADRRLGLAPVRREVEPGTQVLAGGRPAVVVALPFDERELGDAQGSG